MGGGSKTPPPMCHIPFLTRMSLSSVMIALASPHLTRKATCASASAKEATLTAFSKAVNVLVSVLSPTAYYSSHHITRMHSLSQQETINSCFLVFMFEREKTRIHMHGKHAHKNYSSHSPDLASKTWGKGYGGRRRGSTTYSRPTGYGPNPRYATRGVDKNSSHVPPP